MPAIAAASVAEADERRTPDGAPGVAVPAAPGAPVAGAVGSPAAWAASPRPTGLLASTPAPSVPSAAASIALRPSRPPVSALPRRSTGPEDGPDMSSGAVSGVTP
ncbi:hypothetical protein ASF82_08970 [Frigoribacterium sp. Leaf164]|nr:hypothetical protein ASF82_08970 [Frigoribacterium sp. Leaf164]